MKWGNTAKEILSWCLAFLSFIGGWAITIAGFSVEPVGEIHPTVIVIFGQAMMITGALTGFNLSFKNGFASIKEELHKAIEQRFTELRQERRQPSEGAESGGKARKEAAA